MTNPLVFDGHNDVLSKLHRVGGVGEANTFISGRDGHIDIERAKSGGFGGGFFAIYVPSPIDFDSVYEEMSKPQYDLPLPEEISCADALPVVLEQAAILFELEKIGGLKICTSVDEIKTCMSNNTIAAIMHMEGAEAIDPDFHSLEVLYNAGLRSIGPVWSRPTIFGDGVPFRFPSDGDIGPGLTEHGTNLVKRCNEMGIMVDLSHLNEAGFWDVAKHSYAPLVATHSNCHAITPHARNLTDKQLAAIAESDGMVGLNFAVAFLREDGRMLTDVPLSQMLRHIDYLLEHLGENRVGLGSDFDGAELPDDIADAAGLVNLRTAMRAHGYDEQLLKKLCHDNWLRVLEKTWGN
ncbi:MAG: dipeptidase [Hyphomicrobiales bacterium]